MRTSSYAGSALAVQNTRLIVTPAVANGERLLFFCVEVLADGAKSPRALPCSRR